MNSTTKKGEIKKESEEARKGKGGVRCLYELNRVRRSGEADLNKGNRLADAN